MNIEVVVKINDIEAAAVPFDCEEAVVTADNRVVFKNTTREVEYIVNVLSNNTAVTVLSVRDYHRKDAVILTEAQLGASKAGTVHSVYRAIVARAELIRQHSTN